jgi:hypothetical protein
MKQLLGCAALVSTALTLAFAGEATLAPVRPVAADKSDATNTRDVRLREAKLRHQLRDEEATKIKAVMLEVLSRPRSPATASEYLVALELLAQKIGEPALEFARAHPFKPMETRVLRASFVRGASKDPDAVEAWIVRVKPELGEEEAIELATLLLRLEAQTNPQRALKRAVRLAEITSDPRSQRQNYAMVIMESLVYVGAFQTAWESSANLEPIEIRDAVRANLVGLAADHRPAMAIAWFRALPKNDERSGALFRVVEALAARNFREAVGFYRSIDPSDQSADLVGTLITHGNDPAPTEIETLLKDRPAGAETDQLVTVALAKIDGARPAEVPWNWLGKIDDRRMRDRFLRDMLSPRYRKDSEAVHRLLQTFTFLADEERTALQANLALLARPKAEIPAK